MEEEFKISKENWEENLYKNKALIIGNLMQIEMAKKVILLCEEKIAEFPKEEEKKPLGV
jgi:hypothetical protein